ncbi:hypothetical protein [Deinococcus yavapaiensis]|uniref:Universal stress protein family protein n=1 Tax=Deinococcus yavapaiensis KR-236 TaxID=694435 RepID=A0A318SAD3_9DEIO|nr:hypothetical protein [Deinococcus yavapaiensis]PYE56309.1 hypothetical protein DES52_101113 [Deinococcus yavapaiensis KR-236]
MYRSILTPIDLSLRDPLAPRHAFDLARLLGCRVTLVASTSAADGLSRLASLAEGARRTPELVVLPEQADPERAFLALAYKERVDLLVVDTNVSFAAALRSAATLPLLLVPPSRAEPRVDRWLKAAEVTRPPLP